MIVHLGEAPTHGHYQNLFFGCDNYNSVHLGDDNIEARRVTEETIDRLASDTYICLYVKC